MRSFSTKALLGVSLVALMAPLSAVAQTAPAAAPAPAPEEEAAATSGEEIIVTARRRDESVQDVPGVVNAVTSAKLDQLNIRKFEDVVSVVPGLTLGTNANGIGATSTLRGVKFDVNASGNNGTVEYYMNDAPISAGVVLQSLFDVGQIEVLRGPQGTLRGRASPSGSITVTTHKPDLYKIGGYASITGTNIGGINGNAAIGVPIIPGVLAVRVAGLIDENEGTRVKSILPNPEPYSKTKAGRVSVRFDPLDSLSFNVSYQRLEQNIRSYDQSESVSLTNTEAGIVPTNPFAGNTLITSDARLSSMSSPRQIRQTFDVINGSGEFRFAGQRLVYVGAHTVQKFNSLQPTDVGDLFGPGYTNTALQTYGQLTKSGATQDSHEVRLQSDERLFGVLDYVVGGLINRLSPPTQLVTATPVFCSGILPVPGVGNIPCAFAGYGQYPSPSGYLAQTYTSIDKRGRSLERSAFGNVTVHIGSATEISGGIRYINYKVDETLSIYNSLNSFTAFNDGVTPTLSVPNHQQFNHTIFSGVAKHRFSDNLMVYASVGTSWRPPASAVGDFSVCALNGVYFTISPVLSCANEQGFQGTKPETSVSYEAGFKSTWLDRKLTLNATFFHQNFKNFVYRAPGNGAPYVTYSRNSVTGAFYRALSSFNFIAGVPVEVNGAEVEASFRASQHFNIGVSASYALGKIKNGLIPCADANKDGVPDTSEALPTLANFDALGQSIAGCRVNMRANDAPLFTGIVQAEYSTPVTGHTEGYLRGLLSYYGNSQGSPTNAYDSVNNYGLLNLFLGLRDSSGAWDVMVYGKNITGTDRVLSRTSPLTTTVGLTSGSGITEYTNYRTITTTSPREFGLTVRYAFGAR